MATLVTKDQVMAAGRRVMTVLAAWTNLLFDGAAGSRLAEVSLPPDGVFPADDPTSYMQVGSAGGRIEGSIVLTNLEMAFEFTTTGEWRGRVEQLVGVVDALESFRVLLELNAISGPYTDGLLRDEDREVLLQVLNSLLARRWLANGTSLTLPQLALLAGLSEKTVRMAAMGRDRNPDLQTYKDGTQTLVRADEAERWLRSRPSYKPTKIHGGSIIFRARTNHQVSQLLTSSRERAALSVEQLGRRMEWGDRQVAMYAQLEGSWWDRADVDVSLFDVATVARLARVLKVDDPLEFVSSISTVLLPYRIEQQMRDPNVSEIKPRNQP